MITTVLDGLTPETRYKVSVYAAYSRKEGQPLHGEETTDGKSIPACIMTSAYDRVLSVSLGWASRPEVTYPREGKNLIYCI